jgi:hypothetical protein
MIQHLSHSIYIATCAFHLCLTVLRIFIRACSLLQWVYGVGTRTLTTHLTLPLSRPAHLFSQAHLLHQRRPSLLCVSSTLCSHPVHASPRHNASNYKASHSASTLNTFSHSHSLCKRNPTTDKVSSTVSSHTHTHTHTHSYSS